MRVLSVSGVDHLAAADAALVHGIGVNNILAVIRMRGASISKIYSFGKHFDLIEDITRFE